MKDSVVIVSAKRTPIGKFSGSLATIGAVELGALSIRANLSELPCDLPIDEVILGNVLQAGLGQNPARQAAIQAGIAIETPAYTVNKVCGSGLKSVILGTQSILSASADVCVVGGMENMSAAPYLLQQARFGYRLGSGELTDVILQDGLTCAINHYHMGITAENIAKQYRITRQEQDAFALLSQRRSAAAIAAKLFQDEIVPILVHKQKQVSIITTDESPRSDATLMRLEKLPPIFEEKGTVTVGNASTLNDGAATLVLMKESFAKTHGIPTLARIRSWASAGVASEMMGLGPIPATQKALQRANLTLSDIDLIEANEAFAAQYLAVEHELKLPREKTNIQGGAIALGHPIGASGARILVTLIHALQHHNKTLGLATLCIGGGQGITLILERTH